MVGNSVGRKAQVAQKCATSKILDDVFPDGEGIDSFTIPTKKNYMLIAQLRSAQHTGSYESLPNRSIAESLTSGLPASLPEDEQTEFSFGAENGWQSQRLLEE